MFKTILFPTDFSDVSAKALDYIKQLKQGGAETVILLHVIDQRTILALEQHMSDSSQQLKLDLYDSAEKNLKEIEGKLKKSGLKVKIRVQMGFPVREILNIEKEDDVSVIVIGSHGKSNMEEMFLGSVSEKVIRKCKRPILVIKR